MASSHDLIEELPVELRLDYNLSRFTPSVTLTYHAEGPKPRIIKVTQLIDGDLRVTNATHNLFDLVHRYREKHVACATLAISGTNLIDNDGDGRIDLEDGRSIESRVTMSEILSSAFPFSPYKDGVDLSESLDQIVPNLSGVQALNASFQAECGSLASVIHELKSHSLLWASIPPRTLPNEVHRHLGGNVYFIFYRGRGSFHHIHPVRGFETIEISISDANPFHFIALHNHHWYQPINRDTSPLLYFMIHHPAFEESEMLFLPKRLCPSEWGFEY